MPNPQPSKGNVGSTSESNLVEDHRLMGEIALGNDDALRQLMDRYDRLVRYTIFRTARTYCARDPQWLDAVASESWNGIVAACRRGIALKSGTAAGYLSGVARQQAISALRRARAFATTQSVGLEEAADSAKQLPDPQVLLEEVEAMERLRECFTLLDSDDQAILAQLGSITQRRWVQAGNALGMSESTLRSRWARILETLKDLLQKKPPDRRA
jgi:RNA polymerase sigma factor (sigma-70 family)